jgi:hypothetical protein
MERVPCDTTGIRRACDQDDICLSALRAEFSQFRIWGETVGGHVRYIARRLDSGTGLHTVVTPDLAELRAELSAYPSQSANPTDPSSPT